MNLFNYSRLLARLGPRLFLVSLCLWPAALSVAANSTESTDLVSKSKKSSNPAPTLADVPYGSHPRQKIDFWQAKSDKPTPVVVFFHGGGWVRGDKSGIRQVKTFLDAGISVVSANYRYTWQAQEEGVNPPVKGSLEDAARVVQFVRSKAAQWTINKNRIGAWGGSAGACSGLWLALHDNMADPKSNDPVARESTRLWCAALASAQTTLDPKLMREWTPNSNYGAHAFGFPNPQNRESIDSRFDEFLGHRDELLPMIEEYSPLTHAGPGDPSLCLVYDDRPALGQPAKDPTHTANFAVKLVEKLKSAGADCKVVYDDRKHTILCDYLIKKLKE